MLASLDQRALGIVERCLDLEGAARARCIAKACAGSPELLAKVERMLAMDETRFKLLPTEALTTPEAPPDPVPERIGAFRVTGTIGSGGMGTVVAAERDDGVYRQKVAIKLIRAGLKDARAQERFALERRILARLSHPGIARILDGGSADGRPYLVMEYVEGRPVTVDTERRRLGLAQTLDRFAAVCEAVSHAHRNLVVHADIKPSNVIAAEDGSIKLVDFGIARLTAELDEDEIEGPYPLTKGYAAPERLRGEPPTVASDVYSLGALLHEMLSGHRPDGRAMSEVAAEAPRRFGARQLAGELDAIVAKALADDPARRYPDVASLAADLGSFCDKRPVSAVRPTLAYRSRRFLARNRLPLAIGGAVFALLAAAAIVSTSLYLDARRQRAAAEARFEEVRSLAKFQLFTLYGQLAALPGTLPARERLTREAQLYLDRLAALPDASAAVKLETAMGYNRLAEVQGVPNSPNLGRIEAAKRNLDKAAAMLVPLASARPANPAALRELARARLMQADMAIWQDNATAAGERLLGAAEPLVAAGRDGSAEWRALENQRRTVRLDVLGWSERYAEESAFASDTLGWLERLPAAERRLPAYITARAEAHNARAEGDWYRDRRREALVDAREADRLVREALARHPGRPELLSARLASGYNLITSLEPLGLEDGILEMALDVLAVARRLRAIEPNDRMIAWRIRNTEALAAQLLSDAGRHGEAVAIQAGIVQSEERRLATAPADTRTARDLAFSRKVLGNLHWTAGRAGRACAIWRSSEAAFARLEQAGTLNEWDKSNVVAGLRSNLAICRGEAPASAYRSGA
jgi:tRNA A-37 threonylcarbamoyl transferase component Bud32